MKELKKSVDKIFDNEPQRHRERREKRGFFYEKGFYVYVGICDGRAS
jgi:hypothetical protein